MPRHRHLVTGLVLLLGLGCSETIIPATANQTVATTEGTFAGTVSSSFSVTGSGFGQVISDQAKVTYTAHAGTPFEDGTAATTDVTGTIDSDTLITAMSPLAVIAGPTSVGAQVLLTLPSGVQIAAGDATFLPPTATGVVGSGVFPAAIPTAITINGENFAPVDGTVTIHITSADALWAGTTETEIEGTIVSATTITSVSPLAAVCGPASSAATIDRISFPDGSTTPDGTALAITFQAPTAVSIANTALGSPHENTASFAAAIPETFGLAGTGFGPVGGTAQVEFLAADPIFAGQTTVLVSATIVSDILIHGTSPAAAVCNGPPVADVAVSVRLPDGACTPSPLAASLLAPTLATLENTDRGGTDFFAALPETFRITGTDFGPTGGSATVRFTASTTLPFAGEAFRDVTATIVDRTTIQGTSPQATLCPALPGGEGANSLSDIFRVDLTLPGGSCSPTSDPLATTIFGPAITSLNASTAAPVDVPSTTLLDETTAEGFTLGGSGFGPVGGKMTVTFADATGGTPFDGESSVAVTGTITDENTITGTLPTITNPRLTTDVVARVSVALANGSCAFFHELANFVAPPTITTVTNLRAPFKQNDPTESLDTAWLACIATPTEIAGTGFHTDAEDFIFDTDTEDAIGTGMLADATVTATLIAGLSPTDDTLSEPVSTTVRVVNPDQQFHEQTKLTWETTGVLPNANATQQLFTEAEMHMVVNPKDPLNAAVCSHDGLSGFAALRHVFTKDGGATWTSLAVGPPGSASADGLAANGFRFDPMNAVDAFGNIYVIYGGGNTRNSPRSVFAHQSRDGGATFPLVITMPFAPSAGLDRWTAATGPDPAIPGNQVLYVACVDFGSSGWDILVAGVSIAPGGSVAAKYAAKVVNDAPRAGSIFFQHGTPSVGPGGELFVSYGRFDTTGSDILMDVDEDGLGGSDSSLGSSDTVVATTALPFRVWPTVQPSRGYGVIPMHKVVQTGTFKGRVVIVYTTTATPSDPAEDLNVVTQYSDDNGATWSTPTLVHPVDAAHQFHPWLDTDPVRGDLYVTWYDSTNDLTNNRAVERFAAVSTNGSSWGSPLLLSQGQSDAQTNGWNDYLEYNGVAAYDRCVYACWADNSNFNIQNPGGTQVREQFDVYVAVFMLDPDE
ncbi:MAG: hypothetical protein ACYS0K_13965 [Planctomycetota bacterium]|jgi:hypothetical protein